MGKRRKRMTMAKYAKKYAAKRAAMAALRGEAPPAPVVEEPVVETPTPKPEPVVEITALKSFFSILSTLCCI